MPKTKMTKSERKYKKQQADRFAFRGLVTGTTVAFEATVLASGIGGGGGVRRKFPGGGGGAGGLPVSSEGLAKVCVMNCGGIV